MKTLVLGSWFAAHRAGQQRRRQAEVDALHAAILAAVERGASFSSGKHFAARGVKYTMWISRAFRMQHGRPPRELFAELLMARVRRLREEQRLGVVAIARRVGLAPARVRRMLEIEEPRKAA